MSKADRVLEEIERVALQVSEEVLPIVGREKGSVLENIVKSKQPKMVLEIGTLVGYSTILMAKNMKNGRIVSIEVNRKNHEAAQINIERAGLSESVELLQGDALKTIPGLEGEFDMVFIDARKDDYLKYLKAAEPKMAKRAIVAADNVKRFAGQMKDFLEYVRNSGRYKSKTYEFGADAVEVSERVK